MIVKLETLTKRGLRTDTLVKLLEHGHLRDVGDGKVGTTGPPSSWGAECYELWKAIMPHSGRKG